MDGRINGQVVTQFVRAYQSIAPLRLGELWAVPIMLRLTLIENLRRVAFRIAWRRRHRDLALEIEGSLVGSLDEHRVALELWRKSYNEERPHEALGMRRPAEVYRESPRPFEGAPDEIAYPPGWLSRKVRGIGSIRLHGAEIRISAALAGWHVGLRPGGPESYLVAFGGLPLGRIDMTAHAFHAESGETP